MKEQTSENQEVKETEVNQEEVNKQTQETSQNDTAEQESAKKADQKSAEEYQAEIDSLKDQLLRQTAEFQNFRRRTLNEKMELVKNGGKSVILEILPIVDDMERAVLAAEKNAGMEEHQSGLMLITKKFSDTLTKLGVKAIDSKDVDFDENMHEAVTTFEAGEDKKGKVIDTVQKGYMLNDTVIRFAKVVVGK